MSDSLAIKGMGEYEEFDCRPYIDMTVEEYFHSCVRQLLSAMKDRLKERMSKEIQAKND